MTAGKDGMSKTTPAVLMAHLFGITGITLMLVWLLHFREGVMLKSDNKAKIFNGHPLFMLLGLIICGGEAIMAFRTVPGEKKASKFVHMALHLVALILGGLGLYAVFKFHMDLGIPNMKSLHSWLGLGTIVLFALQWFVGFFSFLFPGATMDLRAKLVPWHALLGLIIFVMAICSAETGLAGTRPRHGKETLVVNSTGITILLFGVFVIIHAILVRKYY